MNIYKDPTSAERNVGGGDHGCDETTQTSFPIFKDAPRIITEAVGGIGEGLGKGTAYGARYCLQILLSPFRTPRTSGTQSPLFPPHIN